MSNKLLKKAVRSLSIVDVFLISCNTERKDLFVPPYISEDADPQSEYKVQFLNAVKDYTTLTNPEGVIDQVLYQYDAGFRYINKKDDDDVKITFTATFAAVYNISGELDEDALYEFGKENVGFNVWPYWRELVSSVSNRFRLGSLTVPLYKMGCDS